MTDIYNRKYITEDGNEYIVVSSSYVGRDRYEMMINLNNNQDYFFTKMNDDESEELEIAEDKELIRDIISALN
jgi:hypothetical protein